MKIDITVAEKILRGYEKVYGLPLGSFDLTLAYSGPVDEADEPVTVYQYQIVGGHRFISLSNIYMDDLSESPPPCPNDWLLEDRVLDLIIKGRLDSMKDQILSDAAYWERKRRDSAIDNDVPFL